MLSREESLAYLVRDGAHLKTPVSRYGHDSQTCAPVAYAVAIIVSSETGEEMTHETLEWTMGLVVNDHEDPAYMINEYGKEYGFKPNFWE